MQNKTVLGILVAVVILLVAAGAWAYIRNLPSDDSLTADGVTPPTGTTTPDNSGASITSTPPSSTPQTSGTRSFTMTEVAAHNSRSSCYVAVGESVYDVTSWIPLHPGGPQRILNLCGTDGTSAFENQHEGQARPEQTLAGFRIGALVP